MDSPSPTNTFEALWRWIPERLVQTFPFLRQLRAKSAVKHAKAASAAYDAGNSDGAVAEYSLAVELEPNHDAYLYGLGRIYYGRNDLTKAEDYFRRTLNVNFSYALAIKGLGYTVHRLGKLDEAIYCYLRYLDVQPEDVDVHANLIAALEAQGRYDEAIAAASRAISLRPDYALAHLNLGNALKAAGRVDEAVRSFGRAMDLAPDLTAARNNLASTLLDRGRTQEAIDVLRRLLAI
jgi:protein O-GlcNAc transferase